MGIDKRPGTDKLIFTPLREREGGMTVIIPEKA
jgi:hypothetical protein